MLSYEFVITCQCRSHVDVGKCSFCRKFEVIFRKVIFFALGWFGKCFYGFFFVSYSSQVVLNNILIYRV